MLITKITAKIKVTIPATKTFTCLSKSATKQKDTIIRNSAVKVPETSIFVTGPPANSCLNFLTTSKNLSYNHIYNIPPTNCEIPFVTIPGNKPNNTIMIKNITNANTIDFGAFLSGI